MPHAPPFSLSAAESHCCSVTSELETGDTCAVLGEGGRLLGLIRSLLKWKSAWVGAGVLQGFLPASRLGVGLWLSGPYRMARSSRRGLGAAQAIALSSSFLSTSC